MSPLSDKLTPILLVMSNITPSCNLLLVRMFAHTTQKSAHSQLVMRAAAERVVRRIQFQLLRIWQPLNLKHFTRRLAACVYFGIRELLNHATYKFMSIAGHIIPRRSPDTFPPSLQSQTSALYNFVDGNASDATTIQRSLVRLGQPTPLESFNCTCASVPWMTSTTP
jgi:hypothetical protein